MNAPDPSNEPQIPLSAVDALLRLKGENPIEWEDSGKRISPAEQAEPQSVQSPTKLPTIAELDKLLEREGTENVSILPSGEVQIQPDAFARVEAWQAESPETRSYWHRKIESSPCFVQLADGETTWFAVDGLDLPGYPVGPRVVLAKAPGLAATIEAALEKAEEVNL